MRERCTLCRAVEGNADSTELDIEVLHLEGVFLDELAAGFDLVARR